MIALSTIVRVVVSPVIIDYFDFRGISLEPYETDSILIVDPNAVLPETIAL
jgi:hypothetical protein